MNIVIVEDEIRTRNGMVKILKNMNSNYNIIGQFEDGYDGMRNIKLLDSDLVITDIMMPRMNGLDMIDNLIKCNYKSEFVILSGHAEFDFAQRAMRFGVTEYLLKPITINLLIDCMKRIESKIDKKNNKNIQKEIKVNDKKEEIYSLIVKKVLEEIDNNCSKKHSLDEYSRMFGVTAEYLSSLFTKETGSNFSNYIKSKRISLAKELLIDKSVKIYEIACITGYDDPKYFCKVFKESVGISPKEFRLKSELNRRLYN